MELRVLPVWVLIFQLHGLEKGILVSGLGTLPKLPGNKLAEGNAREPLPATPIHCGAIKIEQLNERGTEKLWEGLVNDNFAGFPFTAGPISSPASQRITGNQAKFSLATFNRGMKKQYALQIDEDGEKGYWLPQGGTIDIPRFPSRTDPKYVFTPDFSGCSWTITPLGRDWLRLRHVEGGMEGVQFNNLRREDIGGDVTYAMEYKEYGYYKEPTRFVSHVPAFAYMRYMSYGGGTWILKFQRKTCAPTLGAFVFYPHSTKVKSTVAVETQSNYPAVGNTGNFRAVDWIPTSPFGP